MRLVNPEVFWTEISKCPDDKQVAWACEASRGGHNLTSSQRQKGRTRQMKAAPQIARQRWGLAQICAARRSGASEAGARICPTSRATPINYLLQDDGFRKWLNPRGALKLRVSGKVGSGRPEVSVRD
jgi:hypothetical protein